MTVMRDIAPDFSGPDVCAFLNGDGDNYSQVGAIAAERAAAGFEFNHGNTRLVSSRPMPMRTYITKKRHIYTARHRFIRTVEIIDPVDHDLELQIVAALFTRPMAAPLLTAVVNAFQNTNFSGQDIDAAEAILIRSGVAPGDFAVDLLYALVRRGAPQYSHLNLDTFEDQVSNERDETGARRYIVEAVEHEDAQYKCDSADCYFDDRDIIVVPDVDDPREEFSQERHGGCDGLVVTDHRIGTAFQYYEWKTEWEVRPIRIGPCEIMRTKIPVFYSRIRKEALWCYATTTEEVKHYFEKIIVRGLEKAAIDTAVLAIVTGGLGLAAAAEAFASSFFSYIEKDLIDAAECFFGSLRLVAELGDWEEKIF